MLRSGASHCGILQHHPIKGSGSELKTTDLRLTPSDTGSLFPACTLTDFMSHNAPAGFSSEAGCEMITVTDQRLHVCQKNYKHGSSFLPQIRQQESLQKEVSIKLTELILEPGLRLTVLRVQILTIQHIILDLKKLFSFSL